jgi:hypothetical protein
LVGLGIDHFYQVTVIFRREEEILRPVQNHLVRIPLRLNSTDHPWSITDTDNNDLAIT